MRRRLVTLAIAVLACTLSPALANALPPFWNSTVPPCISLVGSNGAVASAKGTFDVVVRDLANNPMPGIHVTVNLSQAPDLHLCAQQLAPGVVMDCPNNSATVITDAAGRARFTLLGGGNPAVPFSGLNNGRVFADGVLIASPTVSAFDLDGVSGVGANDFSLWFGDFVAGGAPGRSDFDCSGSVGANDLSLWLNEFGSGASTASCAAACP
jgi:hypothetical protein